MRKRFALQLAAPLLCGAMAVGCGGADERRPQQEMTQVPEGRAGDEAADARGTGGQLAPGGAVGLTGCVEAAPGTDQFVLRNVRQAPTSGVDPQRDTTGSGLNGITEGSWVRLEGGDRAEDLRKFAGHRVTLTGVIADTGANTIGTSGASDSRAAGAEHYSERVKDEAGRIGRESMADGMAAMIRVTAVESTNERCPTDRRPETR